MSMNIMSMKSYAKRLNDYTFTDYFHRLMLLARSVFKWENLPNSMDEKWIEKFLFRTGFCVFYNNPTKGLMVAECTYDGNLNNYEEPVSVTPIGIDIEPVKLTVGKDCVLIRNNDVMMPTAFPVKLFAYRLAEISRTIDINVNAQKTPVVMYGTDKQKLTMKNMFAQWNGNEPVIYGDKNIDTSPIGVLKTEAPIVFPQLQIQKQALWNECLTFLGINNANTEKRERLITDEVIANNTHIDLSADCLLKSRELACKQINKLFGTEIKVGLREEVEPECMHDTQNISET